MLGVQAMLRRGLTRSECVQQIWGKSWALHWREGVRPDGVAGALVSGVLLASHRRVRAMRAAGASPLNLCHQHRVQQPAGLRAPPLGRPCISRRRIVVFGSRSRTVCSGQSASAEDADKRDAAETKARWDKPVQRKMRPRGRGRQSAHASHERREASAFQPAHSAPSHFSPSSNVVDPVAVARALSAMPIDALEAHVQTAGYSVRTWNRVLATLGELNWEHGRHVLRLGTRGRGFPKFNTLHYNALVTAAAKGINSTPAADGGDANKILGVLEDLDQAGLEPTYVTFVLVVSSLVKTRSWPATKEAMDKCATWRAAAHEAPTHVQGARRQIALYNALLGACVRFAQWKEARAIWAEMQSLRVPCDRVSFGSLLRAATAARAPEAELREVEDAVRASALLPDAALFDALLQACVPARAHARAAALWQEMAAHGLAASASSFAAVALLRSSSSRAELEVAEALVGARAGMPSQDEFVARIAVGGELAERGVGVEEAVRVGWRVLEEAKAAGAAGVRVYNSLITLCGKALKVDMAVSAFEQLRGSGVCICAAFASFAAHKPCVNPLVCMCVMHAQLRASGVWIACVCAHVCGGRACARSGTYVCVCSRPPPPTRKSVSWCPCRHVVSPSLCDTSVTVVHTHVLSFCSWSQQQRHTTRC